MTGLVQPPCELSVGQNVLMSASWICSPVWWSAIQFTCSWCHCSASYFLFSFLLSFHLHAASIHLMPLLRSGESRTVLKTFSPNIYLNFKLAVKLYYLPLSITNTTGGWKSKRVSIRVTTHWFSCAHTLISEVRTTPQPTPSFFSTVLVSLTNGSAQTSQRTGNFLPLK